MNKNINNVVHVAYVASFGNYFEFWILDYYRKSRIQIS